MRKAKVIPPKAIPLKPRAKVKFRHLVFCIDGTGQSAISTDQPNITNVFNIALSLAPANKQKEQQIVFYYPGIAANLDTNSFKIFGILKKYLDQLRAIGFDEVVHEIYANISINYRPGDKLYFFGFSRGAIAARVVCEIISLYGLLRPEYILNYGQVWNAYQEKTKKADIEEKCYYDDISIKFLGLFDAVFGEAGTNGNSFLCEKLKMENLPQKVLVSSHLLAIDEERGEFPAIYMKGKQSTQQVLEHIWIPGVHADIGGMKSDAFFGNTAFLTMIDRVRIHTSLNFYSSFIKKKSNAMSAKISLRKNMIQITNEFSSFGIVSSRYSRTFERKIADQYLHKSYEMISGFQILDGDRHRTYGDVPIVRANKAILKIFSYESGEIAKLQESVFRKLQRVKKRWQADQ